jgi:hypothetical protein
VSPDAPLPLRDTGRARRKGVFRESEPRSGKTSARLFDGGVFGPWDPETCSTHLLRWFDQGLIQL